MLLDLQVIPLKLKIHSDPGYVEYTHGSADLKITRERHGLAVNTQHARLSIDTFDCRNSIVPTTATSIKTAADQGIQAAQAAAAEFAMQGKRAMNAPIGGEVITQFAKELMFKNMKTNIGIEFIPKVPPKITYIPGSMEMQFEADRLNFDWRVQPPQFKLHRAHADISVAQYPDVKITYTAPPLYVPRSANPGYHPINTKA